MIGPMGKRRAKRHPGTLRLRGKSYWLTLCVGGERHYFTIPTTDRDVAERFALDRARELRREQDRLRSGLPGIVRCSALFDVFERNELSARAKGTQDAYRDSLGPLRAYFVDTLGDPTIDRIRATHVVEFMAWRRVNRTDGPEPLAGRTVAKDRAVLPVARVAAPKFDGRDPVILSADEYERLLKACEGRETLRLRWEDVNLQEGFLWVASGREGTVRNRARDAGCR